MTPVAGRGLEQYRPRWHKRAVTGKDDAAPDAAEIERLARAAVARLPAEFAAHLDGVLFRVEERADRETLDALDIADPLDLSGLYYGRPLDEQSIWSSGELPAVITLYRAALIREWIETGVDLGALVTHVVVHEVGHHFGLSDEDMDAIESEDGPD